MIKVAYTKKQQDLVHLLVEGHAQSDKKGKDLVCAGVSAVLVGGANALKISKKSSIKIEEGYLEINFDKIDAMKNKVVMDTIITQLKTIQESNPKNIKFVKE